MRTGTWGSRESSISKYPGLNLERNGCFDETYMVCSSNGHSKEVMVEGLWKTQREQLCGHPHQLQSYGTMGLKGGGGGEAAKLQRLQTSTIPGSDQLRELWLLLR